MKGLSKSEDANKLLKLRPEISEALKNFEELSKKKPNDPVNKFKLKFVNNLLSQANELLSEERYPDKDFRLFDEDDLPSNSDVVMMLTQYSHALDRLYKDAGVFSYGNLEAWIVDEERWEYDRKIGIYRNDEEDVEEDEDYEGDKE